MRVWIGSSLGGAPSPPTCRPWASRITTSRGPTVARLAPRLLISRWPVSGSRTLMCPLKSIRPSAASRRIAEANRALRASGSRIARAPPLPAGAGEELHPAAHQRLAPRDLLRREEPLQAHPLDRVGGALKVLLVSERHRGVDRDTALEARVHRRPLSLARREALLRDEGLPRAAGHGVQDIRARVDTRGQAPDDLVHVVDVDVVIDSNRQAHALARGHRRDEEVADVTVVGPQALLDLDDAPAPVGHRERDVHVLHEAGLEPLA